MFGKAVKYTVRSIWMIWERGFSLISRFRGSHTSRFGICTVMIKRHRGESITCKDCTTINDGDLIGELHLDNEMILKLLQAGGTDRTALMTARSARKSMEQICRAFELQPEFRQVKALIGVTLLHRGLTHGLGFDQQKMKSKSFERLTTWYLRILLAALHPEGMRRTKRRSEQLVPMMLIHSRASLLARFSLDRQHILPTSSEPVTAMG